MIDEMDMTQPLEIAFPDSDRVGGGGKSKYSSDQIEDEVCDVRSDVVQKCLTDAIWSWVEIKQL